MARPVPRRRGCGALEPRKRPRSRFGAAGRGDGGADPASAPEPADDRGGDRRKARPGPPGGLALAGPRGAGAAGADRPARAGAPLPARATGRTDPPGYQETGPVRTARPPCHRPGAQVAAAAARAGTSCMSRWMTRRGSPMSRCRGMIARTPPPAFCCAPALVPQPRHTHRTGDDRQWQRLPLPPLCQGPAPSGHPPVIHPALYPQTTGKAGRFIQTLLREWAYGLAYSSSAARTADLPRRLDGFNRARPHSALYGMPPPERANDLLGTHSQGAGRAALIARAAASPDRRAPAAVCIRPWASASPANQMRSPTGRASTARASARPGRAAA